MKKKRILIGLSGGVDSAVSAYLLQKQGYEVVAGFMKNYVSETGNCPTREDRDEAIKVASHLGIKTFIIFDQREEYDKKIVQYIYDGYKNGITPNPDVLCNSEIKFKLFMQNALNLGVDYIATGHYARIVENGEGKFHLLKGVDESKDQSYFLSGLNQYQLSKSLFPIGNLKKTEVRKIAKEIGLPNALRKDSQGLCFIGKVQMQDFLSKKISKKEGDILDPKGNIIGKHEGAWYYTIGQRKGIKVGGGPALFVIKKDVIKNTITVGTEKELELYSDRLIANTWHWIGKELNFPFKAKAKIRYRQEDQDVELFNIGNGQIEAIFKEKQRAITSGQTIVVYLKDELVGSGIIC
ncbi:tRNA 2-thiouridine(34) synthase MnmA [Candidatus Gracilibacteria bacterium]|nr:tRNA 2-thiouridine(34) synthase MnmA [Candidatus Gracilibacteria bacterium]